MEDFLKEIGINQEGVYSDDNSYVIDIEDSNDYGRIYSKLEKSDLVDEDEDSSLISIDNSSIQYLSDKYTITLIADFEGDKYTLICRNN